METKMPEHKETLSDSLGKAMEIVGRDNRSTRSLLLRIGAIGGGVVGGAVGFYLFGPGAGLVGLALGVVIGSIGLWLAYETTSFLS